MRYQPGFMKPPAASGFDFSFAAHSIQDPSSSDGQQNYTFNAVPFGADAADRQLVIAVLSTTAKSGSTGVPSSVTVDGVSAVKLVERTYSTGGSGSLDYCQNASLWRAIVPAGTSGTVQVNHPRRVKHCSIGLYRLSGYDAAAPVETYSDTWGTSFSVRSLACAIPAGGCGLFAAIRRDTGGQSWTGATERYDYVVDGSDNNGSGASVFSDPGLPDHTVQVSSSARGAIVGATFR